MAEQYDEERGDAASQERPSDNLCFTYPQGQVSIIPQLLTLMAAVASLLVWPFLEYSDAFGCLEYRSSSTSDFTSSECFNLYLNVQDYWDTSKNSQGWAGAIQAAAVFAIFSSALGFVAFSLLVTATCFVLEPRKILYIVIMQSVAAFCSILTLIAGAADACKLQAPNSETCSREGFRVATGAGFEIFAFLLYLAAMIMTLLWYMQVRPKRERTSYNNNTGGGAATMNSATRPTSTTIVELPDGGRRIEREFIDEDGNRVTEVTTERLGGDDEA